MSIEQVWAEQDKLAFGRIQDKWHQRLYSSSDVDPMQLVQDSVRLSDWKQDYAGNWITSVDDVWVNSEYGGKLPYEIAVCGDFLPSLHGKFVESMLSIAIGIDKSAEFLGSGTRGWAGKMSFENWEMVGIYMHEIDITGVERLTHMNLLSIALEAHKRLRVPKPMFATTNFFVCPLINGVPIDDIVSLQMENVLNNLLDSLLDTNCGWNSAIKIDSNPSNYRQTKSGKVYNIDPVFRNGKIVFG